MFMKKCPDVILQTATVEQVTEKEQTRIINKHSHAVNVEVVVHQVADGSDRQVLHEASCDHISHEDPTSACQENINESNANSSPVQNGHSGKTQSGDRFTKGEHEISDAESKQRNVQSLVSTDKAKKDSVEDTDTPASSGNEKVDSALSDSSPPNVKLESTFQQTANKDVAVISLSGPTNSDVKPLSAGQQHEALKPTGE